MKTFKDMGIEHTQGQDWQHFNRHRNKMGHRNNTGKYETGPGGINCPCCTKLPPNELKKSVIRQERRQAKQALTQWEEID